MGQDILSGTRRKVSIATEGSFATKATTGFRSAILHTEGLNCDPAVVEDPGILGDMPYESNVAAGPITISGSVGDNTLYSEGAFPLAMLHTFGSVSGAQQGGTDAWKWDFTFVHKPVYGATKGLTVKVDRDSDNAFDFYGCVSNSLVIKWSHGQVVAWIMNILGVNQETGTSPTVSKPSINPFRHADVVVTIAGSAVAITEGQITITNNFATDNWEGNVISKFPRNGFASITGSFTKPNIITDDEAAFYNKFKAKTPSTLDISITGDLISGSYYHKLNIACGKIVFTGLQGFGSGGKENPKLPIGFKAYSDGTNMPITAYIINTENSLA